MHIERDGDRRWLVVDGRSPEQLWPQLQEFWQENGFALKTDAPATGIMTTDWAENRANIPDDWFRRTVGKVIDFAYSSGTRDSFRTLVSRGASDTTDISITHSAMEEMLTGQDKTSSRWEERPRDPALEALFLTKLMEKFGLTEAQSKQLLTDARPATAPATIDMNAGASTLDLQESFDRAWLRVGLALDRTNFTVDNRDRAKGIYYVRYADSMQELKTRRPVRQAVLQRQFVEEAGSGIPRQRALEGRHGDAGGGARRERTDRHVVRRAAHRDAPARATELDGPCGSRVLAAAVKAMRCWWKRTAARPPRACCSTAAFPPRKSNGV